jgi:NAD(P)-dependent dehydrogenase (short-subunit alcohol dehydrogenase family)
VTGLAKTLANELGKYRIRVNTVHPHGVNTDLKPGMRAVIEADPGLIPFYLGVLPDPASAVPSPSTPAACSSSTLDDRRSVGLAGEPSRVPPASMTACHGAVGTIDAWAG